jgi:peptidoglycan/xylan/chitin deacetylase (PgdA/CDA1 family)
MKMTRSEVREEFEKARKEFERIFGGPARTAGAAGWQANAVSLGVYDEAGLLYASDARGTHPFFPRAGGQTFKTLQIPTTLPTLDELLGRPEYPEERLVGHYLSLLRPGVPNVLTIHAELEGMKYLALFRQFLEQSKVRTVRFALLRDLAADLLKARASIPICDMVPGSVDGRSGTLVVQRCPGRDAKPNDR